MRAFSRTYGVLAIAGLLGAAGCLRKEVAHAIYVSPAGVTWSATENDVRSDEADPGNRMMEEHDYLLGARAGRHGIARALEALSATRVHTTILRQERPFTVVTEGHFRDLADLANAMMTLARVRGEASIDRDGCTKTFRAWFAVDERADEDTGPLVELLAEAVSYRIVLTEGRFLRADGFTIGEDGAIATPAEPVEGEDGILRVSLTWRESWCAPVSLRRSEVGR